MLPVAAEVAEGVVREGMVVDGAGGTESRAHSSRCPTWRVRGLRFVGGVERMVVVGWTGRETSPSNRCVVLNGRILYVVGKGAVEGSDTWLERFCTRPGGIKEPRNK